MGGECILYSIGVDVGGTFTDLVIYDMKSCGIEREKVLTTPEDPCIGIEHALRKVVARTGLSATGVRKFVHGTTLVTNAIIERKGAKTALITTKGFRDVLEIGREYRYDMHDLYLEMPPPLVPRRLRFEIDERILNDGKILKNLKLRDLDGLISQITKEKIEAVAVCLLHSYRNSIHEKMIAKELENTHMYFSLSSDVVPEIREYERASTTVINAYTGPLVMSYLCKLQGLFKGMGFAGDIFVMLSDGGICTAETACKYPVRMIESGPAAGVMIASFYSRLTGISNMLSFDMGGTTAKLGIVEDEPQLINSFEVARIHRFKKGSGLVVKCPAIDLLEIGAGGGSIAYIDKFDLVRVGPASAGAYPGPACYGFGGTEPTVTDADLVLGYLNPDYFLGGAMKLEESLAQCAIREKIATHLGLDAIEAAWGIHRIVNENMVNAARVHLTEHGKDIRSYTLFAFGGAGPVHAYQLAESLSMSSFLVPMGAGVASALGFLVTPPSFSFVRTCYSSLNEVDFSEVNSLFENMESRGAEMLEKVGVASSDMSFKRSCDMRYVGQTHELNVPVPPGELSEEDYEVMAKAFEKLYEKHFATISSAVETEVLNWRSLCSGPKPKIEIRGSRHGRNSFNDSIKGFRKVYFPELGGYEDTQVLDRGKLDSGDRFQGPAVVEEIDSTIVIGPRGKAEVDRYSNLVVHLNQR